MERPFFSLSKRKRLTPINYVSPDGSVTVIVKPHQDYGMPTIWDADLLIWAASTLNDMKKRGLNDIPRRLTAKPYELLKAIGRDAGGSDCRQLHDAALRLRNVSITTNLRSKTGEKPENRRHRTASAPRLPPVGAIGAVADRPRPEGLGGAPPSMGHPVIGW